MEETILIARKVAERIGVELCIPVYCYENAAFTEERRNLANCRSGDMKDSVKSLPNLPGNPTSDRQSLMNFQEQQQSAPGTSCCIQCESQYNLNKTGKCNCI